MSARAPRPSEAMREGRRALEGRSGLEIVEDLRFHGQEGCFSLRVRISLERAPSDPLVPQVSDWFVLIEPWYPLGKVEVHPAEEGGLRGTFPHQSISLKAEGGAPWRAGSLCLEAPDQFPLGKHASGGEPRDSGQRLLWHVLRARDWLEAAADGRLLKPGDPFELPAWPNRHLQRETVVFAEDLRSFAAWRSEGEHVGLAKLIKFAEKHYVIEEFRDLRGRLIAKPQWGYAVSEGTLPRVLAFWLRLGAAPALPPWQAPRTFAGLRRAARDQGVDLDRLLQRVAPPLRGHERSALLIGFPIPERVGEPAAQMHWQPIEMPALGAIAPRRARSKPTPPRGFLHGFRKNSLGRWQNDREGPLADKAPITWLKSANWHSSRLGARGRFMDQVRLSKIALVGVGALGSMLGEILVRGGAEDVLLLDDDVLTAGNLVRHRLRMDALGEPKVTALAEELNLSSPNARVRACAEDLPSDPESAQEKLADRAIIIDCTGENEPLEVLERAKWAEAKVFFSISVGRGARRLYFFSARATSFPQEAYSEQIRPWLLEDWRGVDARDLPWEGAGCWHPIWPARLDDLMLMAATAAKLLETEMAAPAGRPRLQVFERRTGPNETFEGLQRVTEPSRQECHAL